MTLLTVDIDILQSDFVAFSKRVIQRRAGRFLGVVQGINIGLAWVGIGYLVMGLISQSGFTSRLSAAAVVVVFVASYFITDRGIRKIFLPDRNGYVLGPERVVFDERGIHIEKTNRISSHDWTGVRGTDATTDHFFIWVDATVAYIIPKRDLSREQLSELETLLGRYCRLQNCDSRVLSAVPAGPRPEASGWLHGLGRNLKVAPRLIFKPGVVLEADARQLISLVILNVALVVLLDWLVVEQPSYFVPSAATGYAAVLLLIVASAFFIAVVSRQKTSIERLLVGFLSVLPIFIVCMVLYRWIEFSDEPSRLLFKVAAAVLMWAFALKLARHLVPSTGVVAPAAILITSLAVGMTTLPGWALWYHYDDSDDDDYHEGLDVEAIYYRQHDLLSGELGTLAPGREGLVDLYFAGFASWASQDVFMSEMDHVRALFDRRFDTTARSITLINNQSTVSTKPLASRHNLEKVLQHLSTVMDVEEDVLFLYLSSHGSKGANLAVNFYPLGLNNLEGATLRQLLDDSGIEWRVVVVSACYSGEFIDHLQDPKTLVITASRRDRSSFGCSQEREFTYFGESFFVDQLAEQHSFVAAYHASRAQLLERENQEGLTPSEPQIWIGEAIESKLDELEKRLTLSVFGG